jgi:hypothetical protein
MEAGSAFLGIAWIRNEARAKRSAALFVPGRNTSPPICRQQSFSESCCP